MAETPAYFLRTSTNSYRATEHTSGAWDIHEQHIAPALGLITHVMEEDFASRREDNMFLARISFDIFGVMPVDEVSYDVRAVRPGRTIELVEASLYCRGREIVRARGWFMSEHDTAAIAGVELPEIPPFAEHEEWPASRVWPGKALEGMTCHRILHHPGRGTFWISPKYRLVDDGATSALARCVGVLDFANGMVTRADPREVLFPNLDLTVHFFRRPVAPLVGFDTRVNFGPTGIGLTHTVLHDEDGPIGQSSQILTVRPVL